MSRVDRIPGVRDHQGILASSLIKAIIGLTAAVLFDTYDQINIRYTFILLV